MAQYVVAGCIVGAVYLIYQAGKSKYEQRGSYQEYTQGQDGNDPEWGTDPVVLSAPKEGKVPACKEWNDAVNAYLYMNDSDADKSESVCFSRPNVIGYSKRSYTTSSGDVTYSSESLDFGGNTGKCLFYDGTKENSNTISLVEKLPQAIVNKNKQLCFGGGGYAWKEGLNVVAVNPKKTLEIDELKAAFNIDLPWYIDLTNLPSGQKTRCEELIKLDGRVLGFGYTTGSKRYDGDRDACLAMSVNTDNIGPQTSKLVTSRYVTDSKAVFKSPYTGDLVSTDVWAGNPN